MELILHTDGGSRGNPGPSAIGGVLYNKDHAIIATFSTKIQDTTNNVAEYLALIKGLDLAQEHNAEILHVHMDSELIIRQLEGKYKVKAEHLLPYFQEAKAKISSFQATFTHVPRENPYQARADALVNQALDQN